MELRGRAVLGGMRQFELQILYARGMTKLWEKIEHLRKIENLRLADLALAGAILFFGRIGRYRR